MSAEPGAAAAQAVIAAGWIGQACFFLRFLVQWLVSERARASVVPRSFWWLSLAGSVLVAGYAIQRGEYVLVVSLVIGGAIASRNLALQQGRERAEGARLFVLALLMIAALVAAELATDERLLGASPTWAALGLLGQAFWAARFPLQWWASERSGASRFPAAFWWTSLAGNLLLLAYALHLRDALFVLAYLPGPFLQARNLMLERGSRLRA